MRLTPAKSFAASAGAFHDRGTRAKVIARGSV